MNHCTPFPSQVVCFLPRWRRRCKLNVSSCQVIPVPALPDFLPAPWILQLSWTGAFQKAPGRAGEWSFPAAAGMREPGFAPSRARGVCAGGSGSGCPRRVPPVSLPAGSGAQPGARGLAACGLARGVRWHGAGEQRAWLRELAYAS